MNYNFKLKELRNEKRLTLKQLSNALNISVSTLSKWEKNIVKPNIEKFIVLAKFFNVRANYLLGIDNVKQPIKPYYIEK